VEVTVLGSGTTVPSLTRSSPGLLVTVGGEPLPFDLGGGTLGRLLRAGADFREVNTLFFSHVHPDHVSDLLPFLHATKWTPGFERRRDLTLVGPPQVHEYARLLLAYAPFNIRPETFRLRFRAVEEDLLEGEGWTVRTTPVVHGVPAVGYRMEAGGKAVVYSGDTDVCEGLVSLAREADLLLLECSFPDDLKVSNHLTPTEAGRIAERSGAKRLLLTHLYPPCDEGEVLEACRAVYGGGVEVARDGQKVVL